MTAFPTGTIILLIVIILISISGTSIYFVLKKNYEKRNKEAVALVFSN